MFGRLFLPKKSTPPFHTQQRRKIDFYYDKASKSTKKKEGWRWPSRPADYDKQSTTNLDEVRSWVTRICKYHHRSFSTKGDIDAQSFACSCTRLTKLMVFSTTTRLLLLLRNWWILTNRYEHMVLTIQQRFDATIQHWHGACQKS